MDPKSRLWTLMTISAKEQAELWKLVEDQPVGPDHFVPTGTEPLTEVIHHGKNTLPTSNFFQKRFCLADDDSGDLYGYNHQSFAWATGPGYFVAHPTEDEPNPPSSYLIDYTRLPPKKPASWPRIRTNEERLSRFVYSRMKDYMRRVSEHVSIGRAYRSGKAMDAWFVLCREDPPA
jgi:hypothetical protein